MREQQAEEDGLHEDVEPNQTGYATKGTGYERTAMEAEHHHDIILVAPGASNVVTAMCLATTRLLRVEKTRAWRVGKLQPKNYSNVLQPRPCP